MKDTIKTCVVIAVLFLIGLRVIGFENFEPILLIPFFGLIVMAITGYYGIGDPSVPKCDCGHRMIEFRNGCKTHYDDNGKRWNLICSKCGKKHFVYTKSSEWIG